MSIARVTLVLVGSAAIALSGHAQNVGNWSMSGRVVDAATGRPIEGAMVVATLDSRPARHDYKFSDADGAYHFDRLRSGTYFVCVGVGHRTMDPSWKTNDINIDIFNPGAPTPKPIVDVGGKYHLFLEPVSLIALVRDQPFTFATTFYPSALSSEAARRVVIDAGQARSGVDIGLRRVPSRRVAGTVVGPNFRAPERPGESLGLYSADDLKFELRGTASTITQDGQFVFMAVPPGTYTLVASPATRAHIGLREDVRLPNAVTVGETDVAGLTVTVR